MPKEFELSDVEHIAITVSDLETTKEFYSRILNLRIDKVSADLIFMRNDLEVYPVYITFFKNSNPAHQKLSERGVEHLAFRVSVKSFMSAIDSLEEELKDFSSSHPISKCRAEGIELLYDTYCYYFYDHEGNRLELNVYEHELDQTQKERIHKHGLFVNG